MTTPASDRALERVIGRDFEADAEPGPEPDGHLRVEQAIYAALSAIARPGSDRTRARRGFRPVDPATRPS